MANLHCKNSQHVVDKEVQRKSLDAFGGYGNNTLACWTGDGSVLGSG